MQTNLIRSSVLLSVQTALLGAVSPALRGVTVGWDEKTIKLLCYYDGSISEEDRESMSCVQTEIMADFPELEIELDVVRCDFPQEMNYLDAWVYRRSESMPTLA